MISFQLATSKLRLTTGSQWKRFSLYSLFAWLVPMAFAAVTVVVDMTKDLAKSEYRPGE
jgi:hypothetical protein